MDSKEIKRIEDQAKSIIDDIKELRKQIDAYKSGSESFESSAKILGELASEQSSLTKEIKTIFAELKKIDTIEIADDVSKMVEQIQETNSKTIKRLDKVEAKIDFIFRRKLRHFEK